MNSQNKIRFVLMFMFVLFFIPMVAAVNVSTDKTEYDSGEKVAVNISNCTGISIVKFLNPDKDLVDIKSGEGNWSTFYHTSSDSNEGKYAVSVSCENGLAKANFCVDAPGCLKVEEKACVPDWDCGEWSSCGINNQQSRTCTDKNNCQADKVETKACAACQESWTCLSWSACQNGIQTRTCYDQNNCGTTLNKPVGQQSCQEVQAAPKPAIAEPVEKESFFAKNKGLIIAVVIAAVVLVFGLLYFFKWKSKEASLTEVREWMSSEREKGVSDENIRLALQKRGWEEKDIEAAFKKL